MPESQPTTSEQLESLIPPKCVGCETATDMCYAVAQPALFTKPRCLNLTVLCKRGLCVCLLDRLRKC
jgi:hypothetical protein